MMRGEGPITLGACTSDFRDLKILGRIPGISKDLKYFNGFPHNFKEFGSSVRDSSDLNSSFMDFGPYFRDFRSDLKGFRLYSRYFTSDFRDFRSDFRTFVHRI